MDLITLPTDNCAATQHEKIPYAVTPKIILPSLPGGGSTNLQTRSIPSSLASGVGTNPQGCSTPDHDTLCSAQ